MKQNSKLIQIGAALLALVLAILACGPTPVVETYTSEPPSPTQPQTEPGSQPASQPGGGASEGAIPRSRLIAATVQIFGVRIQGGDMKPYYVGSGSIISSNGLILTNAHVADPAAVGETGMTPDALVIGIVQAEDQPPVYSYRAEVRAIDGYMDLAVLQITATIRGEPINPSSLNLPYVPLGNSDNVHVGDHINILGFPAIGGNTITYTSGNVAGFTAEEGLGDRAWIKTDATISGGNSGGMGTNDRGELIGVPTIASSGANVEATDCRVIQDTNGDGQVDQRDTCIPIGGFINALRPINLAQPLIKAAQSGQAYVSPYSGVGGPSSAPGTGSEWIGSIAWFTVDENGNIGEQVTSYPSGVTVLLAGFDFRGFVNGEPWGEAWYLNGETIYTGNYKWDQGSEGSYGTYLGNQGDPFPDGTYRLELFAGGSSQPLAQAEVTVGRGGTATPPSAQDGIQLSGVVTDRSTNKPIAGAYVIVLNSGVTYDDWWMADFPEADVFTYTKTDAYGRYSLPVKLARNTPYTVVASAEGYYDAYGDNLVWDDQQPANYVMDITLTK